jgi:hypothetical protein
MASLIFLLTKTKRANFLVFFLPTAGRHYTQDDKMDGLGIFNRTGKICLTPTHHFVMLNEVNNLKPILY